MGCAPLNYQEMNVDWVIKTVAEMYEKMQNDFEQALDEYMEKYFTNVLIHATYDPNTETIILAESSSKEV